MGGGVVECVRTCVCLLEVAKLKFVIVIVRAGPGIKGHLITFDRKRIEKKVDHINHSLSERSPKTS